MMGMEGINSNLGKSQSFNWIPRELAKKVIKENHPELARLLRQIKCRGYLCLLKRETPLSERRASDTSTGGVIVEKIVSKA